MFKTEIGEFKGSKTISLMKDDKRVISFGINKAVTILECLEEIKKFVEDNKSASKETTVEL